MRFPSRADRAFDAQADESGRVTLHGVMAGELQLHASTRGWAGANLRSEMRRLHLEAGETRVLELVLVPVEPR